VRVRTPGSILLVASLIFLTQTARPQSQTLTVVLTGQSMLRSDVRVDAPAAASAIQSMTKGDVVFTNFEGAVAEPGEPNETAPQQGAETLAPPVTLDALKSLGFNLLSLANNHAWDLRVPGIRNTIQEADRLNLAHAGTGNSAEEAAAAGYLRTPKGTVALVAMASGLVAQGGAAGTNRPGVNELRVENSNVPNEEDARRILESIKTARRQADLVIVYQHNHIFEHPFGTIFSEELPERLVPPEWIKAWTHREVDAGADIVVLHGAPLIHGVEVYHGRPIFYDLGNFIFNLPATNTGLDEPVIWESVVAYVEFQGGKLQSIKFRPVVLNKIGRGQPDTQNPHAINQFLSTRGLPTPADGEKAAYILRRLADLSQPFGTTLKFSNDTAEVALVKTE